MSAERVRPELFDFQGTFPRLASGGARASGSAASGHGSCR